MKLSIVDIEHQGDTGKEVLTLKASEDCNLKDFIVTDSRIQEDVASPTETFHTYWFHSREVKKGDYILLYSRAGSDSSERNNLETTSHYFHWNLDHPVWHEADDAAVLIEVAGWKAEKTRSFVSFI